MANVGHKTVQIYRDIRLVTQENVSVPNAGQPHYVVFVECYTRSSGDRCAPLASRLLRELFHAQHGITRPQFQGQFFSGNSYHIYLLGNPIIWWGNLVFLAVYLIVFVFNAIKQQRGYEDKETVKGMKKKNGKCVWLVISGMCIALYSILGYGKGFVFSPLLSSLTIQFHANSFYSFSPLAYGMAGPHESDPNSTMYGLRWMESWEF